MPSRPARRARRARRPPLVRRVGARLGRPARALRWELVVAAALLLAVVPVARGREQVSTGRDGSDRVAAAWPVAIGDEPRGYRVVYRVEDTAGPRGSLSTEELLVSRPFDSRLVTRRGAPPGRELLSDQVTRFAKIVVLPVREAAGLITFAPPAIAGSDMRPAAALAAMVERGQVERREVRTVLGRRCQVYRGPAPFGGSFDLPEPTADEHADACFDADGLLLEEVWVSGGKRLRRKVAVAVSDSIGSREVDFPEVGTAIEPKQGGGSVRPVDPASDPLGDSWRVTSVPEGFRLRGRYAVVPPQQGADDPSARDSRIASTVDVWERGIDVLVLDQGGTLGQKQVFEEDEGVPAVDLGAIGRGRLHLSVRMSEVRVVLPKGRFVRVTGTLGPDELVEVARSLAPVPTGGGLRYLDEQPS